MANALSRFALTSNPERRRLRGQIGVPAERLWFQQKSKLCPSTAESIVLQAVEAKIDEAVSEGALPEAQNAAMLYILELCAFS